MGCRQAHGDENSVGELDLACRFVQKDENLKREGKMKSEEFRRER